jgi:hypothetical protein
VSKRCKEIWGENDENNVAIKAKYLVKNAFKLSAVI